MQELQIFKNEEFGEVRTVTIDNEPWFVGKDIAEALEYNEPHKAINRHVSEDDRMKHPVTDSTGREQEAWIINESGLYALIFGSKLESAKRFKHRSIYRVLHRVAYQTWCPIIRTLFWVGEKEVTRDDRV